MRIETTITKVDTFNYKEKNAYENVFNHAGDELSKAIKAGKYACLTRERDNDGELVITYEYETSEGFIIKKKFNRESKKLMEERDYELRQKH